MIGIELRKILFKQYGLILIVILLAVKLFSSSGLFKPDYGDLSPQQREIYLSYIAEYGGKLTDEKEAAIIGIYSSLLSAQNEQRAIEEKRRSGEYATTGEYVKALMSVPEVIRNGDAIERLYADYERANADREHRVLLASDAPAMTTGLEYLLLIFICYISASTIYYERKISNLQKTTVNCNKSYAANLLSLFLVISSVWAAFAAIETAAVIAEIGVDNLSASLVSLESFKNTEYTKLTVLQGLLAIQAVKLAGYVFTSAVTVILIWISKNLILSMFTPVAANIVWIYLLSEKTIAFYQPFSLMRGAPYFTGAVYVGTGAGRYMIHDSVPNDVLVVMLALAVITAVFACIIVLGGMRNKLRYKRTFASAIMLTFALMLCGCSATDSGNGEKAFGNAAVSVDCNGKIYAVKTLSDENNQLIAGYISEFDENMTEIKDRINRNVFERDLIVYKIYASGEYLYYYAIGENGCYINRIRLSDYSEENVYFGDYSVYLGKSKYFDMITVWNEGNRSECEVKDFFVDGNSLVMSTESNTVYSLDISTSTMTYLFEDAEVMNLCAMGGNIYYLNMTGELICFDNSKKRVSERIFSEIYADADYVCGKTASGVFRYNAENEESYISSDAE